MKHLKRFGKINESLWEDFKKSWNESNPGEVPTTKDLPFKIGDTTTHGKIRMIDNIHRVKSNDRNRDYYKDNGYNDGDLYDPIIKVNDGDTNKYIRASEVELVEVEPRVSKIDHSKETSIEDSIKYTVDAHLSEFEDFDSSSLIDDLIKLYKK